MEKTNLRNQGINYKLASTKPTIMGPFLVPNKEGAISNIINTKKCVGLQYQQ